MQRAALSSLLWALLVATTAVTQNAYACGNQNPSHPSPNWREAQRYAGSWTIMRGDPAPNWEQQFPGRLDILKHNIKRIVSHHIVFEAARVRAPSEVGLSCKNPDYRVESDSVGELFQGNLGNSADAQAKQLGLDTTRPIATLVVDCGCGGGVQFHAINDNQLLFSVDSAIYRMRRDTSTSAP